MTSRTASAIGRAVMEAREGVRLAAYRDSKGVVTIGVGHTAGAGAPIPLMGMVLSATAVDDLFARDIAKYEATVNTSLKVDVADHEFDAIVSICYNIGQAGETNSTFIRLLNAGDRDGATKHILDWEKDKVLIPRREAEAAQFHTPYSVMLPSRVAGEAPIKMPAPAIARVADAPVLNGIIRAVNAAAVPPIAPSPVKPAAIVAAAPVLPSTQPVGLLGRLFAALTHKAA